MTEPLLSIQDLDIRFRLGRKEEPFRAVKGISFDIPKNSTVALVGESGSGKSVSAMSILGLLPDNALIPPESRILYGGRDLLKAPQSELQQLRGKDISVIFQEPMTSLNPAFTGGEQIAEVLRLHMGMGMRQAQARVVELLGEVGIPDPQLRVNSYPHEISGGQQQRVMIAMAIACEPKLLIADEPTTALDVTIQQQILDLLAALQLRHRMSVLFITHDLAVVGSIADRVIVMREGVIREQGAVQQIFEAPRDAYTRALLACRPPLNRRPQRLPVIDDFLGSGLESTHRHASIQDLTPERKRGLRGDEPTLLEAKGLAKSFYFREGLLRQHELKAVKGASFRIAKGKTLGVVGESGSGKTTVALLVARLHQATAGEVRFQGHDLLKVEGRAAMPYKRR